MRWRRAGPAAQGEVRQGQGAAAAGARPRRPVDRRGRRRRRPQRSRGDVCCATQRPVRPVRLPDVLSGCRRRPAGDPMSRVTPEPSGAYLRGLLDVDFTDDQLAIATHDLTPQLVVAGAGSGKTMVMAARVVHAVACQGVAPGRVLGLTFTNKAAGELAARVRSSLAKLPARALPTESEGGADDGDADAEAVDAGLEDDLPTVSTYHAYAAGIVRDHALRIGREPFTALLTEATQWKRPSAAGRTTPG